MEIRSKASLAVALSKVKPFHKPSAMQEQYDTDSENAAAVIWAAYMQGDVKGKTIADLGSGTGILGIGCLLLGAGKAYFIDSDMDALAAAQENAASLGLAQRAEFILEYVAAVSLKCDVVVQNPPFGTRKEHADREFLLKAFSVADTIYSMHKASTDRFVRAMAADHSFEVEQVLPLKLILRQTQSFHRRRIHRIEANCYRLRHI
ncbi:methyltransferase [Candidatus Woesearchaeota archaeon]|nr:methyltransferase [Candidatus Woesearchaeota archaeon]